MVTPTYIYWLSFSTDPYFHCISKWSYSSIACPGDNKGRSLINSMTTAYQREVIQQSQINCISNGRYSIISCKQHYCLSKGSYSACSGQLYIKGKLFNPMSTIYIKRKLFSNFRSTAYQSEVIHQSIVHSISKGSYSSISGQLYISKGSYSYITCQLYIKETLLFNLMSTVYQREVIQQSHFRGVSKGSYSSIVWQLYTKGKLFFNFMTTVYQREVTHQSHV